MAVFLPIAAAVGLGSIAKFAYSKKTRCCQCSSKFTFNETCPCCESYVCSTCGEELPDLMYRETLIQKAGRYCIAHRDELAANADNAIERLYILAKEEEEYQKKRAFAEQRIDQVELFPITFKGHVPTPRHGLPLKTTGFHDMDDARRDLKILALMTDIDCVVVQQVKLTKSEDRSNYYVRSLWFAEGLI